MGRDYTFPQKIEGMAQGSTAGRSRLCGSMGASVIWSHIDLYGTKVMGKLVFIAEGISLIAGSESTDEQRRDAGALVQVNDGSSSKRRADPYPIQCR